VLALLGERLNPDESGSFSTIKFGARGGFYRIYP